MEIWKLGLILAAGFAMGFVNTVSAAGSLISLPVLIFTGLPPSVANGTNRIGVLGNTLFSVFGFESKGLKPDAEVWKISGYTLPGSIIGAWYATKIPDEFFNRILSVVMLLFLILTLWNPPIKRNSSNEANAPTPWLGAFWYLGSGFYGGFLQAGSGFLLMAGATLFYGANLVKANLYKAWITLAYSFTTLSVFIWSNKMEWSSGLVLALGGAAGGWFGSRWSVDFGDKWIQRVIVVIIVSFSLKLWFFN